MAMYVTEPADGSCTARSTCSLTPFCPIRPTGSENCFRLSPVRGWPSASSNDSH
jgi:hypothetical protein